MAGQNRTSYARSNSGASSSLLTFFRGAFILLVALTLSFGLGFFVIARMVPAGANNATSGPDPRAGLAGAPSSHQSHSAQPHPQQTTTKPPLDNAPQNGPVLLPETNVQKPDNVGASGKSGTDAESGSKADGNENGAGTSGDDSGDIATQPKPHERSDTGSVQQPASPDSDSTRTQRGSASDTPAAATGGVYRVQIGVYSTREKAEEISRSAADKGIPTTVHVVKQDGRTLYRVQRSVHRDRTRAEADRQKLQDAGFDASIINPS